MASLQARRVHLQRQMRQANATIINNGRDLQRAVDTWLSAAREDALLALLAQLVTCFGRLVHRTPVATGRARVGWHIAGESDEWKPDPGDYEEAKGDAARLIAREVAKLGGLTDADRIFIMNNVEYILPLEAGWSKRQGGGFTAIFLAELSAELERAAAEWSRQQ